MRLLREDNRIAFTLVPRCLDGKLEMNTINQLKQGATMIKLLRTVGVDSNAVLMPLVFSSADRNASRQRCYVLSSAEAVAHFGVTNDVREAGYLLTDGRFLDFSGRHAGYSKSGKRTVDHNDINEVHKIPYAWEWFMRKGNIRLSPEAPGVEIFALPTSEQFSSLRTFFDYFSGETLYVDVSMMRDVAESFEYPWGTSSSKIIQDIKDYFEGDYEEDEDD